VNAAEVVAALVEAGSLSPDLPAVVTVHTSAAVLAPEVLTPDSHRAELADIARVLLGDPGAHTRPGPQPELWGVSPDRVCSVRWVVHGHGGKRVLGATGDTEGDAWLAVLRWRLP